jgi:ribosomal protein L12E/L44/L45/RPP1/RPP2
MSVEVFLAEVDAATRETLETVREMFGVGAREDVLVALVQTLGTQPYTKVVSIAAGALLAAADAQALQAKTESNFEEYAESTAEENVKLRAEVERLREQLGEVTS